jgi:hypothetical protein
LEKDLPLGMICIYDEVAIHYGTQLLCKADVLYADWSDPQKVEGYRLVD